MFVYLALLIPIITVFYLILFQHRHLLWWEIGLTMLIPTLCIFGIKLISQESLMYTPEYWNSYVTRAEYFEEWDEEVSCRHPIYETETYTDSKGNTHTTQVLVGYEHPYDVEYHPEEWYLRGSGGESISCNATMFESLCTKWSNKTFEDLHRDYHSNDGDKYFTVFDSSFSHIEPLASLHKYKNKVKCSDSVFQFKTIDPKKVTVYEYLKPVNWKCNYIYNWTNQADQELLQRWNSYLGRKKKVTLIVLPYVNKSISEAYDQEAYWKGGNKNEFITCIGISSNTVSWCHVISWTPQTILKTQIEREVVDLKNFNMNNLINYLGTTIDSSEGVIRRDFEEFDYITVPVPLWGIILIYILTILSSVGLAIEVCTNDAE